MSERALKQEILATWSVMLKVHERSLNWYEFESYAVASEWRGGGTIVVYKRCRYLWRDRSWRWRHQE